MKTRVLFHIEPIFEILLHKDQAFCWNFHKIRLFMLYYADQNNGSISDNPASPLLSKPNEEIQGENCREHNTADGPGLSSCVYLIIYFCLIIW